MWSHIGHNTAIDLQSVDRFAVHGNGGGSGGVGVPFVLGKLHCVMATLD